MHHPIKEFEPRTHVIQQEKEGGRLKTRKNNATKRRPGSLGPYMSVPI